MPDKIESAPNVPPFVTFVTSAVPMVFDNSMSYYEALCALWKWMQDEVVSVINNNAAVTDEYIALTEELENYVNTYFDNLDVQEEINNKLDQMTVNGQLTLIIKSYVDPVIEEYETQINSEIADISSRVQAAYSGSPIPVSNTSLMTDTSRVYLLTTDGNWYYYNGSTWVSGGTYQATSISENSVLPTSVKDHHTYNPAIDDGLEVGKFSSNGVIVVAANWSVTDYIAVKEGDEINVNLARGVWMEQFDADKVYVTHQNTDNTSQSVEVTYTIPSHTKYVRFNIFNADYSTYTLNINGERYFGVYGIEWLNIGRYNLDDELKEAIDGASVPAYMRKWIDTDMIMFGDSLVSAELDSGNKGGYVGRLKTNLSLDVATNMGISGRPMANGTPNGAGTNTTIKSVTTFDNYNLCLIAAGTNDFKLDIPLGTLGSIGDSTFDTNTFYGAYRDAIEYILTENPDIRICLWTPLQRNNGGYNVNTVNGAGCKLSDYVEAIKKIGEMYALPVLDLYGTSRVTQLTLATFTVDGLHLNGHGYDVVTEYASSYINNI